MADCAAWHPDYPALPRVFPARALDSDLLARGCPAVARLDLEDHYQDRGDASGPTSGESLTRGTYLSAAAFPYPGPIRTDVAYG